MCNLTSSTSRDLYDGTCEISLARTSSNNELKYADGPPVTVTGQVPDTSIKYGTPQYFAVCKGICALGYVGDYCSLPLRYLSENSSSCVKGWAGINCDIRVPMGGGAGNAIGEVTAKAS